MALLALPFWIGSSIWIGKRAQFKGFAFWPYFVFSLIAWPYSLVLAVITLRVADKLADEKEMKTQKDTASNINNVTKERQL